MSATTPSTIKPVPKKGWLTRLRQRNVLPGFGLSMGITVFSLSLLVVLPFAMMAYTTTQMGWTGFWETITQPQVTAAKLMDVVFGDANQYGVWYIGRMGARTL